jgi:hypothetical protein
MTNQTPRPKNAKLPQVQLPADLQIEFANLVRISHTPAELIFDFAQMLPGGQPPQVSSRIIMTPLGAKLFHRALSENLAKYESVFGTVQIPGDYSLADHLFRSPPENQKPDEDKP